jgi:hypothetical protein
VEGAVDLAPAAVATLVAAAAAAIFKHLQL